MASVDDRVVSMKFDNAAFERKLGDTLKSLDKLKQSLDFANSTRGMNELSNASKNFSMAGVASAVEGISGKFLALTTIGVTALATITSKAIESGARITQALSFGPVLEGFQEYETNMNSIQTILANTDSKGTTLQNVNDALEKLNLYSDQTIYNFSQMARNIGTFTAAGVDLDKSVNSIKGIANLAAISGSNSEQASTAMYQLSQALASGTVKLMDWNSVVNAGMGGEVFQKALFETGKALKTIKDVPMGQTFEEWKKAGNSFRGSLEQGWITGEVLTNTLQSFTGDLTEAQLLSMGYTKEQAAEMMRLGKIGKAAATEVKTLSQLMSTVKESVASGWSQTFKLILGDFNEAKSLFTGISNAIGGMVSRSAESRNELLKGWRDLNGREILIQGLEDGLYALGRAVAPIREAFREIFPEMTIGRLIGMTAAFANFTKNLKIGEETADRVKRIFAGFFAVIEIGWEIFKGFLSLVGDAISGLSGAGGTVLKLGGNIGDFLVRLNRELVQDGKIREFFDRLGDSIERPIQFIGTLASGIVEFFSSFRVSNNVGTGLDVIKGGLSAISDLLGRIAEYVGQGLSGLGEIFSEAFDFDTVLDGIEVGLLGGIAVMLQRFFRNGLKFDFGGGLLEKVGNSLDQLTGTLQTMQQNLKANILMKIAAAVALLAGAVILLASVDAGALAKALTAMAVGFGQLVTAMALLTVVAAGPLGAAKLSILAGGLILLAGAMVTLSVAVKNLSSLSWGELLKGLLGVTVMLAGLTASTQLISANTAGLVRTGVALMGIATALLILSTAVKSFAEMSWGEMVQGLIGVGVGLGLLTTAINFMPPGMLATGVALIAVSVALRILAEAVEAFAGMGWTEMGKGLLGIGAGLAIMAAAMWLMPPGMILMASGLLILSTALVIMAQAVQSMGGIDLWSMAKGLGGLAAMLGILAVALAVMTGTLAGSAALLVAAGALTVLSIVLAGLGNLSIGEILTGLGAMAGVFIVLAGAAILLGGLTPVLLGLGVALTVVGVGFTLFGAGAYLVAKAFGAIAEAGKEGVGAVIEVLKMLGAAAPEFIGSFVNALIALGSELLAAAPRLMGLIADLLIKMLDVVIATTPKIAQAIAAIVVEGLKLIRTLFPDILHTGFLILVELLRGIRDNVGEIVILATQIMINFATALASQAPQLVTAGLNLLFAFLGAIASRANDIVTAGVNLIIAFAMGMANNLYRIVNVAADIIIFFIRAISDRAGDIVRAGADSLIRFLNGISDNMWRVINAGVDLVLAFIRGIADNVLRVTRAAADVLIAFLNGLADTIREKAPQLQQAGRNVIGAVIDGMMIGLKDTPVIGRAIEMAQGVVGAIKGVFQTSSPSKVAIAIGKTVGEGLAIAFSKDTRPQRAAAVQAQRIVAAFQASLKNAPDSLAGMGDLNPVITPVLDLTRVQAESRNLSRLMGVSAIKAEVSYDQAQLISKTTELDTTPPEPSPYTGPSEINFEQNIYSPTALSTNDIYRNTKSQIAIAKEELSIP